MGNPRIGFYRDSQAAASGRLITPALRISIPEANSRRWASGPDDMYEQNRDRIEVKSYVGGLVKSFERKAA